MISSDLVFESPSSTGSNLVFGGFSEDVQVATLAATIGPPTLAASVALLALAVLSATVGAPGFSAACSYTSGTQRPLVARTGHSWSPGISSESGAEATFTRALPASASVSSSAASAHRAQPSIRLGSQSAERRHRPAPALWQSAKTTLGVPADVAWQSGLRTARPSLGSGWQSGVCTSVDRNAPWAERLRLARPAVQARWSSAVPRLRGLTASAAPAQALAVSRRARWSEGIRPPAGTTAPSTQPPAPDPCYVPSPILVFGSLAALGTNLVFYCERHDEPPPPDSAVVVPIRSVYMVTNNVTLTRVIGNSLIPTLDLTLNLDVDSWAWGFSASVPASQLSAVQPDAFGPVELEASVNGVTFRLLAESLSRERAFGRATLKVSGRGKAALLAAPYSPVLTHGNDLSLTAQQLAESVLTFNAVPLGWDVDWQIDDWVVPAGAWRIQGTYLDGLSAIANAAGAYLRPHRTNQSISFVSRYPYLPRDWAGLTPDFELPSAVTVQEGITWTERPAYNRVFVSGAAQGILADVSISGTAGDQVAPMVSDALVTGVAAGRQRGRSILGATGRMADVRLRLPVLPETGIIQPGALVRYADGAVTRVGLVRSTSVEAGFPEVWQSIGVETHVL